MSPMRALRSTPRGVLVVAGIAVVLLLAVSSRYGFHRDELYFLVAGRRLAWGYVDQPPLVPLIARVSEAIAGASPTTLRVLPALAIGGTALLSAAIARRFGGRGIAQIAAAAATAFSGVALAVGHLLSTATFDYLLWTLAIYLIVGVLDGDGPRWWLGVGATVGVAMLNKGLVVAFVLAVLIGLLVTRQRRLLASPWPWLGAGLAALMAMPTIVWQAANGWPQLAMAEALAQRSDGPLAFVLQQIGLLSIALTVPAVVGLWRLLRSPDLTPFRPVGITFVLLFVVFLVTGGKAYYVSPLYPALLAAGAMWFEALSQGWRWAVGVTAGIGIAAGTVIALPVVPVSAVSSVDATGELGETVGWPELIDQVSAVYESLPADQQDRVTIFTGSYGEAGAVDVLGGERGLPPASSGHNTYWLWGPPARHGPVIGVGQIVDVLQRICPDVARVGTITNPWGVQNEENGLPLLLCTDPVGQLADVWDAARHYN